MNERKLHVIFLIEGAAAELGTPFSAFIRRRDGEDYICAKAIDPEGNYFQLTVDREVRPGEQIELTLEIPHELVKGSFYGADADLRELGYP